MIQMLKCTYTQPRSQLQDTRHTYCGLTRALSSSGLHKSHKPRPYSDVPALKTIKKEVEQSEDLPLFIFDIDSCVLSLIGQLGFARGGKKAFFLNLKAVHVFDIYLSCSL